jgi:hypothetical protein
MAAKEKHTGKSRKHQGHEQDHEEHAYHPDTDRGGSDALPRSRTSGRRRRWLKEARCSVFIRPFTHSH